MSAEATRALTAACADVHCITCGDQGLPLRVVALEGEGLAACRDEAAPGDSTAP